MKLDLRRPTLVLAGAWNPAIFRPGWIGRNVFGMPEGEEFTVNALVQVTDGEQKQVIYINNVGFSASANRLDPDAPHGFHADYRPSYREGPAKDGWQRCVAWLRAHGAR